MNQIAPFAPLKPNFFERRWVWHERVMEFEKKFETIRQVIRNDRERDFGVRNLSIDFSKEVAPKVEHIYKNRVRYTIMRCGDITEYLVTLRLDNSDELYDDVEETKVFENEEDALTCFHAMKCMRTLFPLYVLGEFQKY